MKKQLSAFLLLFAMLAGQAKEKTIVWHQPTTDYGNAYGDGCTSLSLNITKVELKDTETVVYITARQISFPGRGNWFQFAGDTYLKAGSRRYALTKADGIELNTHTYTPKDCKLPHGLPLPAVAAGHPFVPLHRGLSATGPSSSGASSPLRSAGSSCSPRTGVTRRRATG